MIGSYKKIRPISEGKDVQIWLVEDEKTKTQYAAKSISLRVMSEKIITGELEKFKKLSNPHILKTINSFKDDGTNSFVIVTEYCPS